MQKFGLVGKNISYSLSPSIHLNSAKLLGKDISYQIFDLPENQVRHFIGQFFLSGGHGLNITTPYKTIIKNEIVPGCYFSANNVLFNKNGKLQATSTDAEGLDHAIRGIGTSLTTSSSIIILGNGGVVLSILEYLNIKKFAKNVTVLSRSMDHLKLDFLPTFDFKQDSLSVENLANAISMQASKELLLIQATNAPSYGENLSYLLPAMYEFQGYFVDLVYKIPSSLFDFCRKRGIPAQDGLPMLIEQARLAQQIWWGCSAPYENIFEFLKNGKT